MTNVCVPLPVRHPSPWQSPRACPHPIPAVYWSAIFCGLPRVRGAFPSKPTPSATVPPSSPPRRAELPGPLPAPPLLPRAGRRPCRRPAPPPATRSRPPPRTRSRRRTRRPMPGRRAPRRPAARPCCRSSRRRRPPPRSRSRRRTRRPTPGRRAHRLGSMCGRALITASSLNRGQLCGCHHAVPNRRWPQQPLIRKEA